MTAISRGYLSVSFGQMHYATAGRGRPVLLLHQTPRSWDEFRELIPLLAGRFRVVALDTAGYGASDVPPEISIEGFADAVVEAMSVLEIRRAALVGHHTGGVIAVDIAARYPDRVTRLVLSSTPFVDAAARRRRALRPPIDEVERTPDGAYLQQLWQRRAGFYPEDEPDLLERFVIDALRSGDRAEEGHRAVGRYRMEDTVGLITQPVLLLGAAKDPYAFPELDQMRSMIPHATTGVIEEGMVPLVERQAEEVAGHILAFLEERTG